MVAEIPPPVEADNKDLKFLVVPITSDRGLCGGVNRCPAPIPTSFASFLDGADPFIRVEWNKHTAWKGV
jgi:hypothetical protein